MEGEKILEDDISTQWYVYHASVTIMSHLTSTSSGRFHTLEDEPSASEQNYSHVLVEP